jgi:hypothetical protein
MAAKARSLRLTALLLCAALLLGGCLSSLPAPLPAGNGQGQYSGTFMADDDNGTLIGSFMLSIDAAGLASGSGQLNNRDVVLSGQISAGELDGTIQDVLSGLSGRFDGDLFGNQLIGDLRLAQEGGGDDLEALWQAALSN